MQRYFISEENLFEDYAKINSQDAFHISTVMRSRVNDEIIVSVSGKNSYLTKIMIIFECLGF